MASRKAISVKIATPKVIAGLEEALTKLEADYATQEQKEAEYQIAYKAWQAELGTWAMAHFSKAENLRTNYRSWSETLNVDFDIKTKESNFPTEPEKDFETIHASTYRESKKEIQNAIRILKMTDEETVNTSTYNAVAQYL
jgi:hypothetical protein